MFGMRGRRREDRARPPTPPSGILRPPKRNLLRRETAKGGSKRFSIRRLGEFPFPRVFVAM